MPTYTSIDGLTGYINFNIPNELEQIKCSVYGNEVDIQATDLGTLIEKIGIAAAVKNMVYTDAMTEEDQATPSDVEKELCLVCHEEIWDLGERYDLEPQERRHAWVKALHTTAQIVRASYPADQVAKMKPFDVNNFDFHAGPDDDEPLESE